MSFSRKLTLLTIAAAFVCTTPAAIPADSLEDLSNSACEAYRNQEYEQALDHAAQLLGSDEALATKVGVFKCVTCTHVAMRQTRRAKDSIAGMLELDGSARFSPDYSYPPPVIDLYHLVRDSVFADGNDAPMDINTIAIGDFEDNSIFQGKYKDYDYSLFARALVHTVGADLAEATDLKIVDRQRIKNILNELEISRSGFADPKQAVQAGRLLGAQTFIFGQYMILSKNKVRIDARVVHTATGEIILTKQVTGDFGGDPEKFLELEKELVVALAQGIEKVAKAMNQSMTLEQLTKGYFNEKSKSIDKREAYVEVQFLTAEALELEDAGKFDKAQEIWQKIRDADPNNEVAQVRLEVLDNFAMN